MQCPRVSTLITDSGISTLRKGGSVPPWDNWATCGKIGEKVEENWVKPGKRLKLGCKRGKSGRKGKNREGLFIFT